MQNSAWFGLLALLSLSLCVTTNAQSTTGKTAPSKAADASIDQLIPSLPDSPISAERSNRYRVKQSVRLDQIPPDAQEIQLWVSIPRDEQNQRLLTFAVDACPGEWELVEDLDRRGSFLHTRVVKPQTESIEVDVSFELQRDPVHVKVDPQKVGPMTPTLKMLLAEHLRLDAPNMEVTPEFVELANEVCGDEPNIAIQAQKLLEHVAATVDHYSYSEDPDMPHCGIGNSKICKQQGGGCCTDLNSYFISLARARGIASRLKMGYRLQDKNRNKRADPGYRCWIEYFVPGYGWISADVVEADTPGGLGHERWLFGLTSRRLFLNEGREFRFGPDAKVETVNHMSIGYAEIDGVPARLLPKGDLKPQITRTILYREEPAAAR
jgi:transglutaminase-like putative cysteine protease